MSCKKAWNREFLNNNFTKKFIEQDLKTRREDVLLDREMSMLPATQRYVEAEIKVEKLRDEALNLQKLIRDLQTQQHQIAYRINRLQNGYDDPEDNADGASTSNATEKESQRAAFVRACPVDGCKGFLSTQWKCGLCETWVCPDCHEIKGANKDAPHTCNQDLVATAKMLAKDSKPCPKCGAMCTKVDGCNQVFAMCCRTVFNWKTGQIETGAVHAPDYFRWLQRSGQHVPRNPLDIPCGGMPNAQEMVRAFRLGDTPTYNSLIHIYRIFVHIDRVEQHTYRPDNRERDPDFTNRDLRIKYMRNNIQKERFKVLLQQREKAREKKQEIYNVLQTAILASTDIFQRASRAAGRNGLMTLEINNILQELAELRNFINEGMSKISKRYSCMVPHITNEWGVVTSKE
jgi:hypothetical protein